MRALLFGSENEEDKVEGTKVRFFWEYFVGHLLLLVAAFMFFNN